MEAEMKDETQATQQNKRGGKQNNRGKRGRGGQNKQGGNQN